MPSLLHPLKGNRRGFTMAELMVVIVLIGVLSALVVPKVSGMFQSNQVKRSLDRLATDVSLARMRAIRSGRPVQILTTSTSPNSRYVVVASTAAGADTIRKVNVTTDYPGVIFSSFSFTFDGRGVLRNAANLTAISATRSGRTDYLRVTQVGMV